MDDRKPKPNPNFPLLNKLRGQVVTALRDADAETRERALSDIRGFFDYMTPTHIDYVVQFQTIHKQRENRAPNPGDLAPDFNLPLLDGNGERVRLSDRRGRPVALLFGSYT